MEPAEPGKVMLFIDGEIPQHDIAAGYHIVFEYLKIFVKNGYKVLFWPFNRTRVDPYASEMEAMGIDVIVGDISFDDFMSTNGSRIDVAIVSRPEVASACLDAIFNYSDAKVIYFAIDLYFLRLGRKAGIVGGEEEYQQAMRMKAEELRVMRRADLSLFLNEAEVAVVNEEDSSIQTALIPWIQESNSRKGQDFASRKDLVFLGSFLHDPNVDAVDWFRGAIFPLIKDRVPDIRISIIGSNVPDEIKALDSQDFRIMGYVPDLESVMSRARVMVAPIRYGAGIKGKIAMAQSYGLPVVTTTIGAEGMGLRDGHDVMIADAAEDFAVAVERVYGDRTTWERIAGNTIEHVKNSYSAAMAERIMTDILNNIGDPAHRHGLKVPSAGVSSGEGEDFARPATEIDDENLKQVLSFDQYGRYAIIRDLILANRIDDKKFKVLDIGGRGNLMKKFLPDDDVFYLDPNVDTKDQNYIVGDGCDIPLEDDSFDFVVSADVFEHVAAADRLRFIDENIRVARRAVILAAPFYSPETALAENLANDSYKELTGGEDHAWLKEHIDNGLPERAVVEEYIMEKGYGYQKIFNNNLRLWQSLIFSNFLAVEEGENFKDFNQFCNERLFPHDHSEESYRTVYFIKLDEALVDLELDKEPVDTSLYLEAIKNNIDALSLVYLKDKSRIAQDHDMIQRLINERDEKDRLIAVKSDEIARISESIEQKKRQLKHKDAELSQRTAEVEKIYSSKSWKITKPFRLFWRSGVVLRREGPVAFIRKSASFTARRLMPRLSIRMGLYTQKRVDVNWWYRAHGKKVTIVIPSYNDHELLSKCLASINKTTEGSRVDIVIVDDASTDQAHKEYLDSIKQDNVEILYQEVNGGFAKTVNAGMESAGPGDVVVLNSDTEAQKHWLESLQFAAYSDLQIGIVGPKLLYPDGTIQYGGSHRNLGATEWFDHYYRFQPSSFPPANMPNYVVGITGACMYIKRDVIDSIGYMDEGYPMAFEDMDYSIRAWNKGYRSYYYPASTLIHHESVSRGTEQGERERESLRYFWEKWGDWFDNRNVRDEEGRIKVIYVLQSTGVGGGHRIVFEHLNRLRQLGFAVELYALEGQPTWFPLDVDVQTFEDYPHLIEALEDEEAIKVATWWETAEPVWLASINKGIAVFFVQDIESSYYRDDEYMQQLVLSKYRKEFMYFTTSGVNQRALRDMGLEPDVIPCGIDTDVFKRTDDSRETNVMLSLGRSHYLKNLPMTMDAWRSIKENQPTLWMFGIEPKLSDGLDNIEYFLKPSDEEVNTLYNKCTVFVQTSRHEGFCLPVLEAMAAGAPVICTDAHGNADFCEHERNCLMVSQDDPEDLRETLERLFSDTDLQERLRQEGYKTADEYAWDSVMKMLTGFFERVSQASASLNHISGR